LAASRSLHTASGKHLPYLRFVSDKIEGENDEGQLTRPKKLMAGRKKPSISMDAPKMARVRLLDPMALERISL
jgi:hypothetical protein